VLVACAECGREISDRADSCPHCGHPAISETITLPAVKLPPERPERRTPVFLILGICALVLSLTTPRLLLFFPIMATLAFAVIAMARKEKAQGLAVIVILLAIGLVVLNQYDVSAPSSVNLDAAEIVDWNWQKDPRFGSRGTIKWNVQVRNKSTQNIRNVKVELTTYDKGGKLITSTFTFVDAIPPGEVRSSNSYADYYGTESTAKVQLGEVHFAH
jgi:hypothetical protein